MTVSASGRVARAFVGATLVLGLGAASTVAVAADASSAAGPARSTAPRLPVPRVEPTLTYLTPATSGWNWMLWSPAGGRRLVTLAEEPRQIFWPAEGSALAWFAMGDQVWRLRGPDQAARAEAVARLPLGYGDLRALWIDRATGRTRIAMRLAIDAEDVLPPAEGQEEARYRLRNGEAVPGPAFPPWGLPALIAVLDWDAAKKTWVLVERRGTKDSAGDTPGLSVIDDLRDEAGVSDDHLNASYGCGTGQCREAEPSPALREAAVAAAAPGRALKPEEVTMLKHAPGTPTLLFGTAFGDTSHIRPPLLWLAADGRSTRALPIGERKTLALGRQGNWLLVADEGGSRPMLFDLRDGRLRLDLPAARAAMWRPRR